MAQINREQIEKMARFLKKLPDDDRGLNFYSFNAGDSEFVAPDIYPSLYHPQAINFFFFTCLHQHGFWHGDEQGYDKPLVGCLSQKILKGSDLLLAACKKAFDRDEAIFNPANLAKMSFDDLWKRIFVDDNGPIDFPDNQKRCQLTNRYARWFVGNNTEPAKIVELANSLRRSLCFFLWLIKEIPGFNCDPFKKKSLLLAMALANRPEQFLKVGDSQSWAPIVDYHLMRLALRSGLVDLNEREYPINERWQWVGKRTEYRIRRAVFKAFKQLIAKSGRSMSFVDKIFWSGRRYCPETEKPQCDKCIFTDICKKRVELFQPIFRTTDY